MHPYQAMETMTLPSKKGQICKFISPLPDEDPNEQYILVEQPATNDADEAVQIVSVTYLQRNMNAPQFAPRNTVRKSDLTVIAEDLQSFVEGLNQL